jgi:hypothetical protein
VAAQAAVVQVVRLIHQAEAPAVITQAVAVVVAGKMDRVMAVMVVLEL